ncbi:hypothetical protein GCM10027321_06920 [Massilia terrae]|uniref:General stress protein 17M-like domain-containing protein n=1 Tax=Massilia terrae TaxID=1811224 RepID=A0ABT2CTM8_9BURK|nr:hypothetical protein [Massilia terrae]MCS0656946.1 hypothetical protein [Massilia terrae]
MEIVRIFDNYDAAQQARNALLAAGFSDASVRLKTMIDEAGPGQSNFTVGNDPDVVGGQAYSRTFEPEHQQGLFLMRVVASEPGQAEQAAQICMRYGARSGDPGDHPPGAA